MWTPVLDVAKVTVAGAVVDPADYTVDTAAGTVTFTNAPTGEVKIAYHYKQNCSVIDSSYNILTYKFA